MGFISYFPASGSEIIPSGMCKLNISLNYDTAVFGVSKVTVTNGTKIDVLYTNSAGKVSALVPNGSLIIAVPEVPENGLIPASQSLTAADGSTHDVSINIDAGMIFTNSTMWIVPSGITSIQAHLVGGGSSGGRGSSSYSGQDEYRTAGYGGGSGYTNTATISVTPGETLIIEVGAGGASTTSSLPGGASTIKRGATVIAQANGGNYVNGGSGGGGPGQYVIIYKGTPIEYNPGNGGVNGSNGNPGVSVGGTGQGTTTKDWGEAGGTLRASGGMGGDALNAITSNAGTGQPNTGDGGGGGNHYGGSFQNGGAGGSGIVLIRW